MIYRFPVIYLPNTEYIIPCFDWAEVQRPPLPAGIDVCRIIIYNSNFGFDRKLKRLWLAERALLRIPLNILSNDVILSLGFPYFTILSIIQIPRLNVLMTRPFAAGGCLFLCVTSGFAFLRTPSRRNKNTKSMSKCCQQAHKSHTGTSPVFPPLRRACVHQNRRTLIHHKSY